MRPVQSFSNLRCSKRVNQSNTSDFSQPAPMAQRLQFPEDFAWGVSTAAYQIEGATNEGGRGDCMWDAFSRTLGKTKNGETGEVAIDHFHRYKEDVQLMKSMGLKHYRLSISWPRIIPAGVGQVNEEGVAFYNALIDELLANGIEPMVTLYHWDLPLALVTEFDGWLGTHVQDAFAQYARVCFSRFGDRVKTWLSLNEPWISSFLGFGIGVHAPGRRINPHTEPYIVSHNMLLAHAKAVDVYRREFQPTQDGRIGVTLNCDWREPAPTDDPEEAKANAEAAERAVTFILGWHADPIYFGDYPQVMKDRVGERLPEFTEDEKKLLKDSSDFFGLNHYSTEYVKPSKAFAAGVLPANDRTSSVISDQGVESSSDPNWKKTDVGWSVVPWGIQKLLLWIQKRYNPVGGIYVTENGCAWPSDTKEEAQHDDFRVDFYREYIANVHEAIAQGANVRGYFAWSFIDNYEWAAGYSKRFGLHWVDYETLERVPKKSAVWFGGVVRSNGLDA
ncbi:Beta-galactosidase [Globisporangium polare]